MEHLNASALLRNVHTEQSQKEWSSSWLDPPPPPPEPDEPEGPLLPSWLDLADRFRLENVKKITYSDFLQMNFHAKLAKRHQSGVLKKLNKVLNLSLSK